METTALLGVSVAPYLALPQAWSAPAPQRCCHGEEGVKPGGYGTKLKNVPKRTAKLS